MEWSITTVVAKGDHVLGFNLNPETRPAPLAYVAPGLGPMSGSLPLRLPEALRRVAPGLSSSLPWTLLRHFHTSSLFAVLPEFPGYQTARIKVSH